MKLIVKKIGTYMEKFIFLTRQYDDDSCKELGCVPKAVLMQWSGDSCKSCLGK